MTDFNDEILPDTRPLILRLVEKRAGIEVQHSGLSGAGAGGRHPFRLPE